MLLKKRTDPYPTYTAECYPSIYDLLRLTSLQHKVNHGS